MGLWICGGGGGFLGSGWVSVGALRVFGSHVLLFLLFLLLISLFFLDLDLGCSGGGGAWIVLAILCSGFWG